MDAVRAPEPPRGTDGAILARGAFFNALAVLASNLRGIFTFLVARLLGSAALGTFGLAWAITDLVSKLATVGLDTGAITHVARREVAGDRAGSRRLLKAALTIALTTAAVFAVVGSLGAWTLGPRLGQSPELVRAVALLLVALPGIVLYRVSNALSRGMGVMHHDIYSRGLTESFGTAGALLLAVAFGARELAPEIAALAGTLASGLVAFVCARSLFTSDGRPGTARPGLVGALVNDSLPIALYDLLNIAVMKIDLIMLGYYVGRAPGVTLETLGIYAAACDVAGGLRKVNQAFNPIFVPVVARQIGAGEIRGAEDSYGYLARWMLALLLPALAVLALAGGVIMRIYGTAFAIGGAWVAVVGAACALNAFVGLGETVLMVKRPRINLLNSAIACGAAVLLNTILIPAFGPLGAAFGMLVPYTLQGVLRGVEIPWIFDWQWPWRALVKPWRAALVALPAALVIRLWAASPWLEAASAVVYLVGYVLAWRWIGLDATDRDVLDQLLPSRRRRAAEA